MPSMISRDRTPEIEMTLDGGFPPPKPAPALWPLKLGVGAVLAAVVLGGIALAALALWVALVLIPVALVAGLVGWGVLRFQVWRSGGSFGGVRYRTRR